MHQKGEKFLSYFSFSIGRRYLCERDSLALFINSAWSSFDLCMG